MLYWTIKLLAGKERTICFIQAHVIVIRTEMINYHVAEMFFFTFCMFEVPETQIMSKIKTFKIKHIQKETVSLHSKS